MNYKKKESKYNIKHFLSENGYFSNSDYVFCKDLIFSFELFFNFYLLKPYCGLKNTVNICDKFILYGFVKNGKNKDLRMVYSEIGSKRIKISLLPMNEIILLTIFDIICKDYKINII